MGRFPMEMNNIDLCPQGWELYDKWVYLADRLAFGEKLSLETAKARQVFATHKADCPRCNPPDYNPT